MKKIVCLLLTCFCLEAAQESWSESAPITTTLSANGPIFLCDIPSTGHVAAVWIDDQSRPVSSFYINGAWSPVPLPVSNTLTVSGGLISLCYHPGTGDLFAAWGDGSNNVDIASFHAGSWSTTTLDSNTAGPINLCYDVGSSHMMAIWPDAEGTPTYSVYVNSWSTPNIIDAQSSTARINILYDTNANQLIAAWRNIASSLKPFYSTFNGTNWTTPAQISSALSARSNVSLAFDPHTNSTVAVWSDMTSEKPFFSSFNSGTWSTPSLITASSSPLKDVQLLYNPSNSELFAAWTDKVSNLPYYASYNGSSWTSAPIPGTSQSQSTSVSPITLAYHSPSGELLATWPDVTTYLPYFSVFSKGEWMATSHELASTPQTINPIALVYHSSAKMIVAVWTQDGSGLVEAGQNLPIFATHSAQALSNTLPVSSLTGKQTKNNFGTLSDYYNLLTWGPSPSANVTNYAIYRDGELIKTVPSSTLSYEDHNQTKHATTYAVVAIDASGDPSTPTTVTVR